MWAKIESKVYLRVLKHVIYKDVYNILNQGFDSMGQMILG